jgi:hypothetical protein
MRIARRRLTAGIIALGAAAVIAGCGGGSDDDSSSAAEYREAADAICADSERQTDAVESPSDDPTEVAAFLREGLTIERAALDRLRALDPPEELRADHEQAVALIDERLGVIEAATERIEGGEDPDAVFESASPAIHASEEQTDALARELGLTVCGSGDEGDTTTTTPTETAPTDTGATTPTAPSGGTAEPSEYVEDVQAAAAALQGFGEVLQSSTSLDDLKAKVPEAQAGLDEFDRAIAELDSYTLDDADLERQRAGLAETGPRVSDVLRRFLDAISEGDLQAVQDLVPEVTRTITEFQQAATANAP